MAWRRSGQTGDEFCRGEGYSAGLLRHWAWRLGLTHQRRHAGARSETAAPRLARVVRVPAAAQSMAERRGAIRIQLAGAQVEVSAGADGATLTTVLRALAGITSIAPEGLT
jgi:hypothetical protein